ncbi:hypothetical protein TIFTF001_009808 [Ficus carica]|uniref:Uncharacterized protein n=1 Tax=Ficus carica TaxID=3494 RepID=A0AA88D1M2_FICCA|nr:hypothetical protein TIFTF001_009808 [Ficus carica]
MQKKKEVKEAAVVTMKFGDEQSDLLDQYERLSFEVHLNLAMQLGRSLSSPGAMFLAPASPFLVPNTPPTPPPPLLSQVRQGRHRRQTGLKKVLWKLLLGVPMIIVRSRGKKKEENYGGNDTDLYMYDIIANAVDDI